jgi:hypothetical protein
MGDADIVILVSNINDPDVCAGGGVIAYASFCDLSALDDRPVSGFINFCPSFINTNPKVEAWTDMVSPLS